MSLLRRLLPLAVVIAGVVAVPAGATPVCTDGYAGGPPLSVCGGRIFPEASNSVGYVQYTANPSGFREYQDGVEYLAQKYPRWISVFTLSARYGKNAVTAGPDVKRAGEAGDTGDGRDILVIKISDNQVPDKGKDTLLFSLSVHGNERGGLEGGLRTAEDLAMAAVNGGKIADGVDNYTSTTGRKPVFHEYEARDVLAQEAVYLVDFNIDGWAIGDFFNSPAPLPYERGNSFGTDLNRQMPTIGRIDPERTPQQENETRYGLDFMRDVAAQGVGGRMAYGADLHGELNSQAYTDIMYPAGQFDSVDHRRLISIAERTKSVIDKTLFAGIADEIENATGGNDPEGPFKTAGIPTKPAHWANVWDTLGYTDTGFIGDFMATDLGVTGMDYEYFLNHSVPDKVWNIYMQENHITASRGVLKTAMAYALTARKEFNAENVKVDPVGRAGYVINPDRVTDADGVGDRGGLKADGIGADGKPIEQRHYSASNQKWFADESRLMPTPFVGLASADIARDPGYLDVVDTLVLADVILPRDTKGRAVDRAAYVANIKAWVQRGGNLVLTDTALHALGDLGIVPGAAVNDITVYQPYANITNFQHPLVAGLRPNARQLVEAAILGYGIGNDASPMTIVTKAAWDAAKGATVGTTGSNDGATDTGTQTSVGELKLGQGLVRIVGGALPTPSEKEDHRYGLRDYGLTYSGTFIMENAIKHDVANLGIGPLPGSAKAARCLSRRKLVLRVARGATLRLNGKRLRVRRSKGKRVAVIDLQRFRGRSFTVVTTRRTKAGKKVTTAKRYRACAAKKKKRSR